MQHGDAAVELGLHIRITGGREDHLAELLVLLADCAACERRGDQASGKQNSPRLRVHRKSLLWLASEGPQNQYRMNCAMLAAEGTGAALNLQDSGTSHW